MKYDVKQDMEYNIWRNVQYVEEFMEEDMK